VPSTAPKSLLEFDGQWQQLKDHPVSLLEYLRVVGTKRFGVMFKKTGCDTEHLESFFTAIAAAPTLDIPFTLSLLTTISQTHRFALSYSMLGSKHHGSVNSVFATLSATSPDVASQVAALRPSYT
jgi:hypothetical protein